MFVNAYDHLVSMGRLLGSDGAMSLYAHTTLSRSVCEAAVRHAWLLDPSISYEQRITRSAAMLFANAENRLTGARQIPARNLGTSTVQRLIDNCAAGYDQVLQAHRPGGHGPGPRPQRQEDRRRRTPQPSSEGTGQA